MGFGLIMDLLYSCTLIQLVTTINYSAIAGSNTLQFTSARTKSSQSALYSMGTAWQQLLSFRDERPLSLLAMLHNRLKNLVNCPLFDFRLNPQLCPVWCWVTDSKVGHSSSSGLCLSGWRPSHASLVTSLQTLNCN
jgi:hypothetical protein